MCPNAPHDLTDVRRGTFLPTAQVIVHVWKDVTNVTEVLAGGYDVIRNVGYDKTSWCVPYTSAHTSASPGMPPQSMSPARI